MTAGAPSRRSRRPALLAFLDEHDPRGGRFKAAIMLLHPGPSLLATAVTVAAGGIAVGGLPSPTLSLRLVLIMLPAQFAFGAANDAADADADRASKPYKPIVRRVVSARLAMTIGVLGSLTSITATALAAPRALPATLVGLAAGLSYDLGLKRTPLSPLTWWAGFCALPLGVALVTSKGGLEILWTVPLTGLLAITLHCANALPDLEADAAAGVNSLPVRLGPGWTRSLMTYSACVTLVLAMLSPHLHTRDAVPIGAAVLALAALVTASARPAVGRRPFPLLAAASAILAVTWLASTAP